MIVLRLSHGQLSRLLWLLDSAPARGAEELQDAIVDRLRGEYADGQPTDDHGNEVAHNIRLDPDESVLIRRRLVDAGRALLERLVVINVIQGAIQDAEAVRDFLGSEAGPAFEVI